MTLTVTGPGGTREMTVEEALQQRTYQDALKGRRMAMREVAKWLIKREEWLEKHAPKPSGRVRLRPLLTSPDPHNADAALLLLGIAAHDPKRADWGADLQQLLLEPWAVQAALRRRRGGQRLTEKERENIRLRTRDHDAEDNGVGYRRPPRTTRFTKGRSGNPAGRPRGRHREAPYEAVLGQMVTIRENGTERRVTGAKAFLLHLTKRGLEGDSAAARASLALIEEASKRHRVARPIRFVLVELGSMSSALKPLRMAKKLDPYRETARLVLEPWLVEAALARLAQTLSSADQRIIVNATRTPHKVRWPEWWSELP